jgi:hypothetical protein
MSEAERRARAEARRARGVTVERVESLASLEARVSFHEDDSVEQRLTAMTRLCRAAWLATGRPFAPTSRMDRASLPGGVYVPEHVRT